jgi:hypothetical protein
MPPPRHVLPRILCLTLRAGSVGHAVLDGFGVAEGSFFTSRLDHLSPSARFRALVRLVRESCRRFRPTRVVFGLPGPHRADRLALANRLVQRLAKIRVALSVKRLRDAARLLVERLRYTMADEIVERLARHFAPDLAPLVDRTRSRPPYWRAAWYALAIALATLVEHHPMDAAALAQPSAFALASFRTALQSALHRVPPPTV